MIVINYRSRKGAEPESVATYLCNGVHEATTPDGVTIRFQEQQMRFSIWVNIEQESGVLSQLHQLHVTDGKVVSTQPYSDPASWNGFAQVWKGYALIVAYGDGAYIEIQIL